MEIKLAKIWSIFLWIWIIQPGFWSNSKLIEQWKELFVCAHTCTHVCEFMHMLCQCLQWRNCRKKKGTETWLAQNFHIESEHISWLAFDKLESFEERKTQLKIYLQEWLMGKPLVHSLDWWVILVNLSHRWVVLNGIRKKKTSKPVDSTLPWLLQVMSPSSCLEFLTWILLVTDCHLCDTFTVK